MNSQKTILVTGGGSGIGKEICKRFYKEGYQLVVISLDADELDVLQEELASLNVPNSGPVHCLPLDLTGSNATRNVAEFCDKIHCDIDILINNAGFGLHDKHSDLNLEQVNAMLHLNILTVSSLCHLFANRMRQSKTSTPKAIINIGSTSAFQPIPMLAAYAASKAFVVSFTEALSVELKEDGIDVHCVCPGTTKTPFLDVAGLSDNTKFGSTAYIAHKIAMSPKDVANLAFNIVGSKHITAVPGLVNKLHYQMTHWLPNIIVQPVVNRLFNR
ncbi:MAG: SDR family NAD(P)-dependent oxidoreductase [Pseudomonadales bacterium]|nr:SDR family NAD(P)-dependent oxidoreductase [Pseudomonadales bacterium]